MIKNATLYQIPTYALEGLEHALSTMTFAPTRSVEEKSVGWVPPRGEEHGALVESNSGALVFQLKVETRKVPAAALADELAKAVHNIEQSTGRKPGKKEKRDLKEELVLSLLPKAFPVQKTVMCIADGSRLILGTTSSSLADDVLDHIAQGKVPTSLALAFDDRISFVMTDGLQLKNITYNDTVLEQVRENGLNPADFDGTAAIAIGELRALVPELLKAMGGEAEQQVMPAARSDAPAEPSNHHPIEGDQDPMYQQAVDVVLKNRKASISLLHRQLVIGYNRAARLLESMEKAGVVSPMSSIGHREVLKA